MDYCKGEGKIRWGVNPKTVGLSPVGANPGCDAGFLCTFLEHIEHPLLHVHGNDRPPISDHSGHRYGKESHAAAQIHHGHARPHVTAEDGVRIVQHATERVVNEVARPPRTHLAAH